MKFLCIPCDSPMKLQAVAPPDRGSLSVVYECPECGYEMAMLTNPFETQLVQSLGVRVGPELSAGAAASTGEAGGKCPFGPMIQVAEGTLARAGHVTSPGKESSAGRASVEGEREAGAASRSEAGEPMTVRWTAAAEARLANIPAFVRPMARTGIERFALERGAAEVDEQMLDAAKDFFGM